MNVEQSTWRLWQCAAQLSDRMQDREVVCAMKRLMMAAMLVLLMFGCLPAFGEDREGSLPDDLAARKPPAPNEIYVSALPFWSRNESQSDIARACIMLNLMRHGFRMAPKGCSSLSSVIRKTDAAVKKDPKWDPLARPETDDVARVAKALEADWAIHGEFGDLHTESGEGSILPHKVGVIDLRFFLIDVKSGEVIYWSRFRENGSGGLWPVRASSIERKLVTRAINAVFDDIASALPEHYAGPEVTAEEVRLLLEAMGK